MNIREIVKQWMVNCLSLDYEATVQVITRDKDGCVIDAEIGPVRFMSAGGTLCVEKSDLRSNLSGKAKA